MSWNPLNSLTGRMVLVTIVAVLLSHAAAFLFYAHERGAALRQAAESAVIERFTAVAQRVQRIPIEEREAITESNRDFRSRFRISNDAIVPRETSEGAAQRIANAISENLGGAEVRASAREVRPPLHLMQRHVRLHGRPPPERITEMLVSAQLDQEHWLNARVHLPAPRPLPLNAFWGALLSVVAVGIGAALVSRQIGRPLADLANAADALGTGQVGVAAPVSGPRDVRRASNAFNAMAERLGRQLNRQRQMLWALSHDLRTPITAIRLRAELIEDETERQRLIASVAEMEQLTEQALSLARAGASQEPRQDVDLADIARTLCGELADLGMNIRAETGAPVVANCRPGEIARAMRNLAENAVKHGGGGIMRVGLSDSGEAIIEVRDEGPGVPADMIARLTEPFFRADEARSSNGAGLGLAIAQAIAEAHGGRLVLKNVQPRGFSASLMLPR